MRPSSDKSRRRLVQLTCAILIAWTAAACGAAEECTGHLCIDTPLDPVTPSPMPSPMPAPSNESPVEAGFAVFPLNGEAPLSIQVVPEVTFAQGTDGRIEYQYGDDAEFETDAVHTFREPGLFVVTQRVIDADGEMATHSVTVDVDPPSFVPVLLSDSDRSPFPETELTEDRLGVEIIETDRAGIRSDRALQPGSGMFYFEGKRLTSLLGEMHFGVVTASHALDAPPGNDAQSVGVDTRGSISWNGAFQESFRAAETHDYGFVVDYRNASPVVHVIVQATDPDTREVRERIAYSASLATVTEPVYVFVSGQRRQVGPQARVNVGNDLTNVPFHYDVEAILEGAEMAATELVLGWGQERFPEINEAPVLSASESVTVPAGTVVNLSASAADAEDGTLTEDIAWVDAATPYATRTEELGGTFEFTPTTLGIHPVQLSVTDAHGQVARATIDVTVTGTLPQHDTVHLEADAQSGTGITLSPDGLSAHWGAQGKYGIRANQGMLGEFQYFEMRRLIGPANQGGGLVIRDGNLSPYAPIDVPPSCSVNHIASVWRNLISEENYDVTGSEYYGFAVDYRGRHPVVYVVTHDSATRTDVVAHVITLDDVTVPVYPMLYGNPTDSTAPFDSAINFGANPFHYDPATVLAAAGHEATGLEVGWGDANTP